MTIFRKLAMKWWNDLPLKLQFYKTIKYNHLITGDNTRHPKTLTGNEIERIWQKEVENGKI